MLWLPMCLLASGFTLSTALLTVNASTFLASSRIKRECLRDVVVYETAVISAQPWAMQMLDATSKLPDGLLYGNINQLGNFEECLTVNVPRNFDFQSQFCRASLTLSSAATNFTEKLAQMQHAGYIANRGAMLPHLPQVRWSFCMPSSCAPTDVEIVVERLLPVLLNFFFNLDMQIEASVNPAECYLPDKPALPPKFWTFIGIMSAILCTVLVCTGCDIWWKMNEQEGPSRIAWLVRAVSLRRNVSTLLSLKNEHGNLNCLHGIRVISMFMIILAHRYSEETAGAVSNLVQVPQFFDPMANQVVLNAMLDVDTFFFLSGFLMCWVFLRETKKHRGKFKPVPYYVYRYFRLTAPLAVVLAYYIDIFPYMGRGPLWESIVGVPIQACLDQWWSVLLYVQNYVGVPNTCIGQSWYLAVDMQLAWLAPLILIPLHKWPKQTIYFMLILLAASCFAPFAVTYVNSYPWSLMQNMFANLDLYVNYLTEMYVPTYMRVTPYLVGLLLAYFMYPYKNTQVKLNKEVVATGWLSSVGVGLTVLFTLSIPYQPSYVYDRVDAAFYAGFHRLGWSLFVAWVVFACANGYGGLANRFFSWKLFLPLSRLAYAAYLVHFIVILYDIGMGRTAHSFGHYEALHKFLGDQPMIFFVAALLHLFIEAPVLNILRHFFRTKGPEKDVSEMIVAKAADDPVIDAEVGESETEGKTRL